MARYAQQGKSYTCAPTLILNALKWAGGRHTIRRDLPGIIKKSKCEKTVPGSLVEHFESALHRFGKKYFTIKRKRWRGVKAMERLLANPHNAVVTLYPWNACTEDGTAEECTHLTLVIGTAENGALFKCVNYHTITATAESLVSREIFSKDHRRRRTEKGVFPDIWLLSKKQKDQFPPPRTRR